MILENTIFIISVVPCLRKEAAEEAIGDIERGKERKGRGSEKFLRQRGKLYSERVNKDQKSMINPDDSEISQFSSVRIKIIRISHSPADFFL